MQTRTIRPGNRDQTPRGDSAECTSAATERGEPVTVGRCAAKDWPLSSVGWMTQVDETGGERIGQRRPESSWASEKSTQVQNALSTGSPSRSGVIVTGKNGASVRVLLTGRRRGETATTKVRTKEQQAQSDDDSTERAQVQRRERSGRRAGSHRTCLHVTQ